MKTHSVAWRRVLPSGGTSSRSFPIASLRGGPSLRAGRRCAAAAGLILGLAGGLFAQTHEGPGGESNLRRATIDCAPSLAESTPIGDRFSGVSVWHYLGTTPDERMFHEWAEAMPAGWLKQTYPWLKEIQVFAASGGSYLGYAGRPGDVMGPEFNRDLFRHPGDRSVTDDYDFSPLVRACRNIVRQGLKPCLKLHAVPLKLSREPKMDWFRTNSRPPADYRVYADYLSALVRAMVTACGRDEVRQWRWMVGTEIDNETWWEAADGTAATSMQEMFNCYDWSVYAVERVLGPETGPIGTHVTLAMHALWDADCFLEHCRSGPNAATGKTGARLDFLGISIYDSSPLNAHGGAALGDFDHKAAQARADLDRHGFAAVPVEVDEGGILYGTDDKWLWTGLCMADSFDASWTALSFRKMLDDGVEHWSRWPALRTGGLFVGIESPSTRTLRLIDRMAPDRRIHVQQKNDPSGRLGVVASAAGDGVTFHVLAYHHSPAIDRPDPPDRLELDLSHLPYAGPAQVTLWRVDRDHGDFWPRWEQDRKAQGITGRDYLRSWDQLDVAHALQNPSATAYWKSRQAGYTAIASASQPERATVVLRQGKLHLGYALPSPGVIFLEIKPAP